jgi:His-Xaa-Ser system protein HxsD
MSGGNEGEAPISLRLRFDARVHSLTVIKKAAYRFLDRFAVAIARDGEDWACELSFLNAVSASEAQKFGQALQVEVLDQDLREIISVETEAVRNAVLAVAFSRTGLQAGE